MFKRLLILLIIFLIPYNIMANENVNVYIFHSNHCQYCKKALDYFHEKVKSDSNLFLFEYEIEEDNHAYNRNLYNEILNTKKINQKAIPLIMIGNDYVIGFSTSLQQEIENYIQYYKEHEYQDEVGYQLGIVDENNNLIKNSSNNTIETIFGIITLDNDSLFIKTTLLGIFDSLNIYYILGFILFLLLMNYNDIRKTCILGAIFIGWYLIIYYLYLMAWLDIASYSSIIHFLKIIICILALSQIGFSIYKYSKKNETTNITIKHLSIPIIGSIILSTVICFIAMNYASNASSLFIKILNEHNLEGSIYTRYIIFYLLAYMVIELVISLLIILLIKKKILKNNKKKLFIIKLILYLIIGVFFLIK